MKLKNKNLIFLIIFHLLFPVLNLFFSGCATLHYSTPIWVKEFGKKTFSKDGIEGIGFADFSRRDKNALRIARDQAYSEAIKHLVIKLKTQVRGTVERHMYDQLTIVGKKYKEKSEDVLSSVTEVMFDAVLGRKYFEEYIDRSTNRYWVFVWCNKEDIEKTISEELQKQETKNRNILKSCIDLYHLAEEYLKSGKVLIAISTYENILSQIKEITGYVNIGEFDNIAFPIQVENNLEILVKSITLTPLREINFISRINFPVEEVLPVKVETKIKNTKLVVDMFPLKVKFVKGKGESDIVIKTNSSGIAYGRVYKFYSKENTIEISPDIDELTKFSYKFKLIDNYKIYFYVTAKSVKETKKFFVNIKPSYEEKTAVQTVQYELISKLKQDGFNIVEDKLSAEYLISGEVDIEYLGDKITLPSGEIMDFGKIHSGNINIEIKDIKKNEIVLSKTFSGIKGFGKSKKESLENLLKKLGSSSAEYIIKNWPE